MNDVKISTVDFSANQSSAASSSSASSVGRTNGSINPGTLDKTVNESQKQPVEIVETAQGGQEQVQDAITKLNDYVQSVQRDLQFQLDDTSGKTIVTVIDRNTSEVVRQIPDEVALKLAQDLQQDEPLSLFNAKV